MSWKITSGPEQVNSYGGDFHRYAFHLEKNGIVRTVLVEISDTLIMVEDKTADLEEVVNSKGRTAVEKYLSLDSPPKRIGVTTYGIETAERDS